MVEFEIDSDGKILHHKDDEPHQGGDNPTLAFEDGTKWWLKDGTLHRDNDKPAVVNEKGDQWWYQDGQPSRSNGPAVVLADGAHHWFRDGQVFDNEHEHKSAVLLRHSNDGYWKLFRIQDEQGAVLYIAGCRRFSREEAITHWRYNSYRLEFVEAIERDQP